MDRLKACPFCRNDIVSDKNMETIRVARVPRIRDGFGMLLDFPEVEFYVKCNRCGARSGSTFAGHNELMKRDTTEEEARQIAVQKWNKRYN